MKEFRDIGISFSIHDIDIHDIDIHDIDIYDIDIHDIDLLFWYHL